MDRRLAQCDEGRVAVTGPSAGGSGALEIALANPGRFAAVVQVATPLGCDTVRLAQSGLSLWSFHNRGDSSSLVASARECRRRLLASGISPLVMEFGQGGHNAWDSAYSSPALYSWLLAQDRRSVGEQNGFTLLRPDEIVRGWVSDRPDLWRSVGDEIVASADNGHETLLASDSLTGNFDLHFDGSLREGAITATILDSRRLPTLRLSMHGSTSGGWFDPRGALVARLDPAVQSGLGPEWTDVRIARREGRFLVHLNGWKGAECAAPDDEPAVRIALTVPRGQNEARWRFLRLRRSTIEHAHRTP